MIGNPLPVVGADTFTCRSSPRSGAGSTIGFTEMMGAGSVMWFTCRGSMG
jgi:hypothetical protein